ncbi:MAG: hypothetical protein K2X00_17165 [Nitrospiraceae bacterium]|jgi:hypothetical protein|nr:hypothetical protein [Nitrospiraceae bacterium]
MNARIHSLFPLILVLSYSPTTIAAESDEVFLFLRGKTTTDLEICIAVVSGTAPIELHSVKVTNGYPGGGRNSYVGASWILLPEDGRSSAPIVGCIKYGTIPSGFGGTTPLPLLPIKYNVEVDTIKGRKTVAFRVSSKGEIEVEKNGR